MKTIAFYSYKGGTGRSLLLANYARYLACCGKSVAVLDFDLEAPGLHHKFLSSGDLSLDEWERRRDFAGLQRYLEVYDSLLQAPADLEKHFFKLSFPSGRGECQFMPAGNAASPDYAARNLRLDWKKHFPPDGPASGVNLFLNLRKRIEETYKPHFLLIDSRTGISDIGSTAVAYMADASVCLFLCNPENFAGTQLMMNTLNRVRASINKELVVIPVFSRIPNAKQEEESAIKQAVAGLGGLISGDQLHLLHEELSMHVSEKLLVGSSKALRDSVLLRDYFRVFYALDRETAEHSCYSRFRGILEADRLASANRIDLDSFRIGVLDAIIDRQDKALRHAGKYPGNASKLEYEQHSDIGYGYSDGEQYAQFASLVLKNLLVRVRKRYPDVPPKETPVEEKRINWDLLGLQIGRSFDFCSELYYLTRYRALFLDVVQLGWVRTFTCFIKESSPIYQAIRTRLHRGNLTEAVDSAKAVSMKLEVCLMGESAAADCASRAISHILSGKSVTFRRDVEQLWKWMEEDPDEINSKMIICDHTVAKKLASFDKDHAFLYSKRRGHNEALVFQFDEDLPVGFLYPTADREWRYLINQAVADAVLDKDIWNTESASSVPRDLMESGIEPLEWDELVRHLATGMNPDDAAAWLDKLSEIT